MVTFITHLIKTSPCPMKARGAQDSGEMYGDIRSFAVCIVCASPGFIGTERKGHKGAGRVRKWWSQSERKTKHWDPGLRPKIPFPHKTALPRASPSSAASASHTAGSRSELLMPLTGGQSHQPARVGFTFGEITCKDHLTHLPFIWGLRSTGNTLSALLLFILLTGPFHVLGKFSFFLYLTLLGSPNLEFNHSLWIRIVFCTVL